MFEMDVTFQLAGLSDYRQAICKVSELSPETARKRVADCLSLAGILNVSVGPPRAAPTQGLLNPSTQTSERLMEMTLLSHNQDVPDASRDIVGLAGLEKDQTYTAVIDAAAIIEADLFADRTDIFSCQLSWDDEAAIDEQAPYLAQFKGSDGFASLFLTLAKENQTGFWDRQAPFIIASDLGLDDLSMRLEPWLRPEVEGMSGRPYLRFWEGLTTLAMLLCGAMTSATFPGDIILGIGRPSHRMLLRITPSNDKRTTKDTARLTRVERNALSGAHRALKCRNRACELHTGSDALEDVVSLIGQSYGLGQRDGFGGVEAEQILSRLGYDYGWGFMYDFQYPQLRGLVDQSRALSSPHQRALLKEWQGYVAHRIGPASPDRELNRLRACRDIVLQNAWCKGDATDACLTTHFSTIDSDKLKLHSLQEWKGIVHFLQSYYKPMETENFSQDALVLMAFSSGQYFLQDPLRRTRVSAVFNAPLPNPAGSDDGG